VINDYMDTMETLLKLQAQYKELAVKLSQTETALGYSIAINFLLVILLLFVSLLYIRSKRQKENERAETSQEKAEQQLR
jgi:large-conductance mechanosensitive channel